MANTAVDVYQLGYMEIIINSIYFQVIAFVGIGGMLRTLKIETIDFDVYKADNSIV
jgi:predicted small integral membrane protein